MSRMSRREMKSQEELPQETPDTMEAMDVQEEAVQEDPAVDVAQLQQDLDAANAKVEEYLTLAQRVQADFDNFRRRNESVRSDSFNEGQRAVAAAMLPVLDNLERAVDAASSSEDEALKNGVELVLKQMRDVYQKYEVTPIDRLGEKFDPNLENAIMQGSPDEGEPGTVCMVLQKGYMMGKHVLRHAMVKVVPD